MENKQPKHTLSVVSAVLGIISVFTSILLIGNSDGMRENNASIFLGLSIYTALPAIICSLVAKRGKNSEIFSTLGLIGGAISAILLFIFIAANS